MATIPQRVAKRVQLSRVFDTLATIPTESAYLSIQSVESENGNMIIYVEEHKLKFLQEFLQWEGLDVFTKKHPSPGWKLIIKTIIPQRGYS